MANRTGSPQHTQLSIERLGAAHPHLAGCSLVDLTHDCVVVLAHDGRTYRAPITLEGGAARITGSPREVEARWVPLQAARPGPQRQSRPSPPPAPVAARWEDLSNMERHRLATADPAAFKRLHQNRAS